MTFFPPWHGRDVPDRGELGSRVCAVYEVVVDRCGEIRLLCLPALWSRGRWPTEVGTTPTVLFRALLYADGSKEVRFERTATG